MWTACSCASLRAKLPCNVCALEILGDMARIFTPLRIRKLLVRNRIWLSPMCMYSCENEDGIVGDWHLVHLGARAAGGFGLIMTEASAVSPEGRISPHDAGIWNDDQAAAWRPIVEFVHSQGAAIGIQLAHAGRKASTHRPFPGEISGIVTAANGGWDVIGPSAERYPGLKNPTVMTTDDIERVIADFASAAERAIAAGFDAVEIHAAHGYLLHSFLSPLSNHREDQWGDSFENRTRFLLETVKAVRSTVGDEFPIFGRVSATDWAERGWSIEDSTHLAPLLSDAGCDLIDVSSGGNVPAEIPLGPGYQVPLAATISAELRERALDTYVGTVGLITDGTQAEKILAAGDADVVLLGRAGLREPNWPMAAKGPLRSDTPFWPPQYIRAEL